MFGHEVGLPLCLLAAACAAAPPAGQHAQRRTEPIASTQARSRYAPSPLTSFADAVTGLVIDLLDDRPPTADPLPIGRPDPAGSLLSSEGPPPPDAELEFVAFAMELWLVLQEGLALPPPAAPGVPAVLDLSDEPDGALRTLAFLSGAGLKLAKLEMAGPIKAQELPASLAGAGQFGAEVFRAARDGRLETLLVGEPERAVLKDEAFFAELSKDRPQPKALERATALARSRDGMLGVRLGDVFLVARDSRGDLWGFVLRIDGGIENEAGPFVFDARPLVRVERFDPRRKR